VLPKIKCHVGVYITIEEIKKKKIQIERRAEDIIRGRAHTPTCKEYAEREKRISAISVGRDN
jgi:hypothetical protein